MSVHVSGTITPPLAITTHQEPSGPIVLNNVASSSRVDVTVGNYANTGNITQTVTVAIDNLVGGTVTGQAWVSNDFGSGLSAILPPNTVTELHVFIETETLNIGDADGSLSFDVDSVWS